MYPNVHSSIVYDCLDMEANLVSINRCMDKEIVVHIDSGILLSYRKQRIWISSNEVDESRAESEVNQKETNII